MSGAQHGPPDEPPPGCGGAAPAPRTVFGVDPGVHDPFADLASAAGARLDPQPPAPVGEQRPRTAYLWLAMAIVCGVTGTTTLPATEGFTRWEPLLLVGGAYLACFVALTRALRSIPVGVAYAIWSGVGIALVSAIGWLVFDQALDAAELAGIGLIVCGVVVIQGFSRATAR